MAEDKNYTNNTERPREDEELEIDLMEYLSEFCGPSAKKIRKENSASIQAIP